MNLVTGELKDAAKNLPRAILIGTSIVIISYLLANFAYYAVLPSTVIISSNSVATVRLKPHDVSTHIRILEKPHLDR